METASRCKSILDFMWFPSMLLEFFFEPVSVVLVISSVHLPCTNYSFHFMPLPTNILHGLILRTMAGENKIAYIPQTDRWWIVLKKNIPMPFNNDKWKKYHHWIHVGVLRLPSCFPSAPKRKVSWSTYIYIYTLQVERPLRHIGFHQRWFL